MKRFIFRVILRPLIVRNYRLRAEGKRPDEWYWADTLAMEWGYFVDLDTDKLYQKTASRFPKAMDKLAK